MKFRVEFNDLHEDENQLEKLGCTKEVHEEYTTYTKEIEDFVELMAFQFLVNDIMEQPYTLNMDMDSEYSIIYLDKVYQ